MKYPVYIISKGRYDNPITAKYFLRDNIDFKIAVEPQEFDAYCNSVGENNVLKLPFSNLGLGSYPARNYCWEHSVLMGHRKHHLFDDNIAGFDRWVNNKRTKVHSEAPLIALENFCERYKNIGIAGFNYDGFVIKPKQPFTINNHVYSAMLIDNGMTFRWRMKYNEDVDLCLNALTNKYCTVLFNAYSINKVSTTAKMKGGNQTELYKNNADEKKILKARSLEAMWPQYVKTVMRFNRPHHFVDWRKHFNHPLIRKPDFDEIVKRQTIEMKNYYSSLDKTKPKRDYDNCHLRRTLQMRIR